MNSMPSCQTIAKGGIRWTNVLDDNLWICQADCPKFEHHASEQISGSPDKFVTRMVERNVMHRLCKRCTEAPEFAI